ncbi:hypothetical protein [Bradyrhizobium glycinis]|uniref:hypothetical protein n=1 Tax=Bradyrhizobium glycinis TaxID=2751812 RepID=UPI0018D5B891|nr:hypothetical protein [Bradyrhizobium glycinis]MBH5372946.1 hypothetical protein [Bradyrhizobium glycinis]
MLDNSPRADLQRLRQAQSRELRAATELLDARQACLDRLATIHAEIESYESEERSRNRRRRFASQKLANAHYRDGTPKDQPGHLAIVRHYTWTQKARRAPLRRGSRSLVALLRLRELERLWAVRYGGVLPNDDAGADDLWIAAQLIRHRQGDISEKVVAWARVWAPWCSAHEAVALAAHVVSHPYNFSADTLAEKIGLTYAERQSLGITTIGAMDVDPAERERLRRARYNANRKQKRRDNGAVPRELLDVAPTNESLRPWEDKGISRATWYRRRRATRVSRVSERLPTVEKGGDEGFATVLGQAVGSLGVRGSLPAEFGGERAEKRAPDTREIRVASAGFEEARASQRPVSSGGSAPVVPGADVARGVPFAPPRPHSLRRTTAHAPVEGCGLSVPQKLAPNARLGLKLSSEEKTSILEGTFRAWDNCRLCGEEFIVRRRQEFVCSEDCGIVHSVRVARRMQ